MSVVRTRFAPSPTGVLHIGSVRAALYSWLYARKMEGTFVLRIEDTDRERSTQTFTDAIIEGMQWLGLTWDEGPFHQTERLDRYRQVAQEWLDQGIAYRCYCSKERLDTLRAEQQAQKIKTRYDGHCRDKTDGNPSKPHVIRFKNPQEGVVEVSDAVHGLVRVHNKEMDDLILIRTDGFPTYNFTVVIDDADMEITHVIRGDDHLTNTPRQINMLKALGAPIPYYAHLPLILGKDGQKLSKRHGATGVTEYRDAGYVPEALLNHLVRLGWSHGDQEIFSVEEMIAHFDINHLSKSPAAFDVDKLTWLNQHYIKTLPIDVLEPPFKAQLINLGVTEANFKCGPSPADVIAVHRERAKTLKDMAESSRYVYAVSLTYNLDAAAKYLTAACLPILEAVIARFKAIPATDWTPENIHAAVQKITTAQNLGFGKVAQPLRVAITGDTASPSIDQTLGLLGKETVLERLAEAKAWIVGETV
jgi:glutamyl-tRNA synthetase